LWILKKELASSTPNREEVSLGSLGQDQLVESQIRHQLAQTAVLSSRSLSRFTCSIFSPPNSWRQRENVTSLTPI
jgi:hypothetical protein